MKSVTLKNVDFKTDDGKGIKISYQLQITNIIKTPSSPQGATLDEIRKSIRVLDALEKCDGKVLELEDADFDYMKSRILATRWPVIDPGILTFVEDVTEGK